MLTSIALLPELRIFHLGHFDHSDLDCQKVIPQDPVFSGYSTKGIVVAQTFEDENHFKKLQLIYLEAYCELTPFLVNMIPKAIAKKKFNRRPIEIKFNKNMSAIN